MTLSGSKARLLGMDSAITRRDFVNGALAGWGSALMIGCGPAGKAASTASEPFAPSGSPWTGFGGVGEYRWSNGNSEAVVNAAHGIRDATYPDIAERAVDEEVDLAIVGGGFSGMTTAYEFKKRAVAGQTCLLLENHAMLGGEAKQNEFEVDGRRLVGPQGSNGGLSLKEEYVRGTFDGDTYNVYTDYYREMGIPASFDLEPLGGGAERYEIPNYHFAPMAPSTEGDYETGYFFRDVGWVRNPARDAFTKTPWTPAVRREMDDFIQNRRGIPSGIPDAEAWLDTISYNDLLDKLGYGRQVRDYIDPYMAVANFGVCGNAISAYAGKRLGLPGTTLPVAQQKPGPSFEGAGNIGVVSFPGGNTTFLRMMLARIIPGVLGGDGSIAAVSSSPIDLSRLDRDGAPIRLRLGATVIDVRHEGDPARADYVIVTYVRDGRIRRVRAKSVVMASGGWVDRRIVTDLPDAYRDAYGQFHYGPVLTANVALRHWRFFDKLGIVAARWFEGLGWHVGLRRNVAGGNDRPLTPDDPIVLTFYIPILRPDIPASAQGAVARSDLLATSYRDYERMIREQMTEMFGLAGFDARRDIAGLVLNRWGHAFCAPQPGFFLGRNGQKPPPDVVREPHGRIVFAHSELNGLMSMAHAMMEAHRGTGQAMAML